MELTNIHPAEAYLRNEQNPSFLYIKIYGERRKLFINRGGENAIGIIAKGKRKRGYIFTDWDNIEKIYAPSQDNEKDRNRKLLLKYQRLARLATHTNNWLRKIAAADPEKSLYENHITTGTVIDGMCITDGEGGMKAGFSKEYRDCGNGYYYLLINDKFMIGYDID